MYIQNSSFLILHQIRRWRTRGRYARSWEMIGRVGVVSACGGHHSDAGRRKIGAGYRGRRSKMPRSRLRRGRGHPGGAPEPTGCDAAAPACGLLPLPSCARRSSNSARLVSATWHGLRRVPSCPSGSCSGTVDRPLPGHILTLSSHYGIWQHVGQGLQGGGGGGLELPMLTVLLLAADQ